MPGSPEPTSIVVVVLPVIARFSPGAEHIVALFPDPERMSLDTAQVLYVTNAKRIHRSEN